MEPIAEEAVADFVRRAIGLTRGREARRALFFAVRNLPYATDAAADADDLLRRRRGNCLAKTDLLQLGLSHLGLHSRRVRWWYELPPEPPEVALLPTRYDLHSAVEIHLAGRWNLVDATHDPPLAKGGLIVADWDGVRPTPPNCPPTGPVWREGADDDAIAAALADLAARYRTSRDAAETYLPAFNAWLEGLRIGPPTSSAD